MGRTAGLWLTGFCTLALVPFLFALGASGFGTMAQASRVVDTIGVWYFGWGLVLITAVAATVLSGLAFTMALEASREHRASTHRHAA
jgi:hypothetical protein